MCHRQIKKFGLCKKQEEEIEDVVYFIRHGETDFNKRCLIQGMSDIPLNDKGVQQAGVAANWFKAQNITFDKVFSSPLVRARKTAAIVSGRTFEAVQPDARIREMDFGVDEGKQYSLIKDLFDAPETYIPPEGAESIQELQTRAQEFLDMLSEMAASEENVHTVLAASHGAALRGIMSCINHCELKDFWRSGLSNCCVYKIHLENNVWVEDGLMHPIEEAEQLKSGKTKEA